MDIATLLGLLVGIGVIVGAIAQGSDLFIFLNLPGALIVLGGTVAATLVKFPLSHFFSALRVAVKAFRFEAESPEVLIGQANEMSRLVRKRGVLALEDQSVSNEFFAKAIQLAADGNAPEFVRKALYRDMQLSVDRHETGQRIFRGIGESAPAFGMIGTLVGLVQMLVNLEDPSSIGPAMAVALLTTLYGALLAHLVALPIADKLELRAGQEKINSLLVIESIQAVMEGENPRRMDEMLAAYVPHRDRAQLLERLYAARQTGTE